MKKFSLVLSLLLFFIFSACVKDTGTIEVTYFEATAVYGNLDEIRSTVLNDSTRDIVNPGKIYVGHDYILIGEEGKGIHVIDNKDPQNPSHINFLNIPGNREFVVSENIIYAESYYDVIKVDINERTNAKIISRAEYVFADVILNDVGDAVVGFDFTEVTKVVDDNSDIFHEIKANNLVYLDFAKKIIPQSAVPSSFAGNSSSASGTVNRLSLFNDYLYIIGRSDLNIISNHDDFNLINKISMLGTEMETIFPYENKIFIGTRTSMEIYDVSNPEDPTHEFTFDHATSCDPVLPVDEAVYITLRTADFSPCPGNINALIVLDISNLATPKEVEEIEMQSPYGMSKINGVLYVGEGENGLTLFDATNPIGLTKIEHLSEVKAFDVMAHPSNNNMVLIASKEGLSQFTVSQNKTLKMESNFAY
ncbi:MAG: hypothetical protein HKO66_04945 [Saprospiraceae bacterium]|nr:hypothetical protein [Bacteroidia bacterium]NNE16260.1 hypothetical protein [Saprospiraceae bacterium]NNL91559.1 hypothetical protein [Saprospiraceae bacterium]